MFKKAFIFARRLDPVLLLLMVVLIFIGIMFIHGSGSQLGGGFARLWKRQTVWVAAGGLVFILTATVDYRLLARFSPLLYAGANGVLIALFFIGKTINQAKSWLDIGPVTLQPSELAKPLIFLFLAWLASRPNQLKTLTGTGIFILAGACPALLIAMQPDWGTALVFAPVSAAIAFSGGIPWRYLLVALLATALALPAGYTLILKERQRKRIQTFFNPGDDIMGAGYNAHQSLLAVGSGGPAGKGYRRGNQYKLGYLPRTVSQTDFIFSVIGEETGFIGGCMLIAALLGLIGCCLRAAAVASDSLGVVLCAGIAAFLFIHTYVNIGMSVGAAPIIGIPLPLVSYGGSFTIATMACLGLVQNVYARRHDKRIL
ncbi:MAG: FtsW/RodA/SpoVE family cell cycle protein [Lentisphaeria bacterium]|nr:FtsW/RodA/SpoVE family cell cycle protein [Lentisphaeria bacterium]